MSNWTQAEADRINALQEKRKHLQDRQNKLDKEIAIATQGEGRKTAGKGAKNSKESISFGFMVEQFAKEHRLTVEKEYRFDKVRRFRFDYCFPELKLGLEFEGIIAGKSRHTSITGYSRDCDKYNLATSLGYRVLRYTALNYNNIETDLLQIKTKEK